MILMTIFLSEGLKSVVVLYEQERKKAALKKVRARLERSANCGAPVPVCRTRDFIDPAEAIFVLIQDVKVLQ